MDKIIIDIVKEKDDSFESLNYIQLNYLLNDYYLLLSTNSFNNDIIQRKINNIHTILYNKKNN